jgi:hypothetical protein
MWYGWERAVYFTATGRARHTIAHADFTFRASRKVNGSWRSCKITADGGRNYPDGTWIEQHFLVLNGNYKYFPSISGEVYIINGRTVAKELVWEFFSECPLCGQPMSTFEENTYGTCSACEVRNRAREATVHNYSYKPYDVAYPKNELRFGVELELTPRGNQSIRRRTFLMDVRSKLSEDTIIFKRDGSIGDSGVELVTSPILEKEFGYVADAIFAKASEFMVAGERCGMHVHISKAPLTELQRGKIMAFLNFKENDTFLASVAGRRPNTYCQKLGTDNLTYNFKDGRRYEWSRYTHYNIMPRYSDEFRLFASTTDKEEFLTRLEFVSALVKYCAPGATHLKLEAHRYYKNFVNWVSRFRKFYPHLFNHFVNAEVL